jgi:modification methylase
MKTFPDKSVNCVITSPPYNLGNNHHTGNNRHNPYTDDLPEEKYQIEQGLVLDELYRIVKDEGSIFYNHKNRIKDGTSITPYNWLLKTKWIIKQEMVWFNGSQNFDKIRFYPMTERIYWLVKDKKTKLVNVINHHDLFRWKPEGTSKKHTRSFPEKLVSDLLVCLTKAEIILDPYMGSGTVCVVAKKLGRKYIGIEINPDYVKIAKQRLAKEIEG